MFSLHGILNKGNLSSAHVHYIPPNGIYVSFKLGESQDQISPVVLGSVLDATL